MASVAMGFCGDLSLTRPGRAKLGSPSQPQCFILTMAAM